MSELTRIAHQFLTALAANDPAGYAEVLAEDVGIRIWHWEGIEVLRPRERVVRRLGEEWSAWPDATVQMIGSPITRASDTPSQDNGAAAGESDRIAIEFRIQATDNNRYVEYNRSAFMTIHGGKIREIDLYCGAPLPSARRKGWIAPTTLSADEVKRLIESFAYSFDPREWIPPVAGARLTLSDFRGGSGDPHPGSNSIFGVRWPAEQADERIAAAIAYHREHDIGFQWLVTPFDQPADLRERLERHGLVLAGDQASMARVGLDHLEIATNPDVTVELLDGSDEAAFEAGIQIVGRCFNWSPEQIDERRPGFFERVKSPAFREQELSYLARLDGIPVATATLVLNGGVAFLGGAGTLPEYRGRKIYSTLLRRRLEDAQARGYNIATILAEPMSRRVVSRYGFEEYGRTYVYGWMPVIDMQVIRGLVPDE
jgi:hypothetical protein